MVVVGRRVEGSLISAARAGRRQPAACGVHDPALQTPKGGVLAQPLAEPAEGEDERPPQDDADGDEQATSGLPEERGSPEPTTDALEGSRMEHGEDDGNA